MRKLKTIFAVAACFLAILFEFVFCQELKVNLTVNTINGKIIKSHENSPVPCLYENVINGKTLSIPKGNYLWLVVHPEGSGGYWPQNIAIVPHPINGNWIAKFWLGTRGTDIGVKFELWFVLVDRSGNQVYLDYLNNGRNTGKFPEIPLPENYKALEMISLTKANN